MHACVSAEGASVVEANWQALKLQHLDVLRICCRAQGRADLHCAKAASYAPNSATCLALLVGAGRDIAEDVQCPMLAFCHFQQLPSYRKLTSQQRTN